RQPAENAQVTARLVGLSQHARSWLGGVSSAPGPDRALATRSSFSDPSAGRLSYKAANRRWVSGFDSCFMLFRGRDSNPVPPRPPSSDVAMQLRTRRFSLSQARNPATRVAVGIWLAISIVLRQL